uniref:Hexosyltransferase n=1 Tax=Lactuca sativa TaxID=4236 RepID=A0A9R1XTG6_LACSA|nr:hypothetical protein LSAT_V11C100020370 [Lactuca sativa]
MKMSMKTWMRKPVLVLLFVTVLAPIVLYTDRLATFSSFCNSPLFSLNRDVRHLNLLPQETRKEGKSIEPAKTKSKKPDEHVLTDTLVKYLKDQLIRGRLYLSLSTTRSNTQFIRELRLRMKELQRALGNQGCRSSKEINLI